MKIKFALPVLVLPVLLCACATPDGVYPSLAIRDGERMTGTMEPVQVEPYVPPATPEAVLDQLSQLASQAQGAHAAFVTMAPKSRPAIVAGLGQEMGSDGWVSGQVALAGLETTRNNALIALADLDRLYADAVTDNNEGEKIAAVRSEVLALVAQEESMLAAMTRGSI
jgi:hypothetical protein